MSRETERKINSHFKNLQELYYQTNPLMQVSVWPVTIPPGTLGLLHQKVCSAPGLLHNRKCLGGGVNKWRCLSGRVFTSTGFQTWKLLTQSFGLKNLSCLSALLGVAKSRRLYISNCLFADLGLNIAPKFFFKSFLDDCVWTTAD